jgi:hypothetical protein
MTSHSEAYGGFPAWAVRGQQVVCLFDAWEQLDCFDEMPARQPMLHEILTIRDVITTPQFNQKQDRVTVIGFAVLLAFDELGHDWLYISRRFRPLVANKSEAEDLAQFLPLLKPQKATEAA